MSATSRASSTWTTAIEYLGFIAVLGLLCAIFGALSDNFLTAGTVTSIANKIPYLVVVSVGMTLVLIIAGIDLSVGSLLAVASAVMGVLIVEYNWPVWLAVVAGMATGTIAGALNGLVSVGARIPSFIVTLGMLEIARGATYLLMHNETKYIGSKIEWFSEPLSSISVSPAFVVAIAVVLVAQFALSRTTYGRYCQAIGGNPEAVRMSGINAKPYEIATFAIVGLLCGLGGLMYTSKLSTADPGAGIGLELQAIAAAVIGGTSLAGGRGSVIKTFFGVLVIAVLDTGLAQIGASESFKKLTTGSVIILAVLLDAYRTGLRHWFTSLFRKS